jgi:outer membrane cobalamin receptor
VIVTERTSWLPDGFEQRRAAGFGRFLTRKDIESRTASNTTDLLRGMPGIQLTPVRRGRGPGQILQMRGTAGLCQPAVWIDGVQLADDGAGLDAILAPGMLEAIEIYNSTSTAPSQYRTGMCGVVLFWTKRSPPDDAKRTRWWKIALGASVGIGLVLLLRGR